MALNPKREPSLIALLDLRSLRGASESLYMKRQFRGLDSLIRRSTSPGERADAFRRILFGYCCSRLDLAPNPLLLNNHLHTSFFKECECAEWDIPPGVLENTEIEDIALLYESIFDGEHSRKRGIYYTPPDIALHIVEQAVRLKTDHEETPSILDPACGAGVFLLKTLHLLSLRRPAEESGHAPFSRIFGVDIDETAVEVCRILLLLRLHEISPGEDLPLPDLSRNIMHGNALISPEDLRGSGLEDREEYRSLSMRAAFPAIFREGGFDCIIGNPPYGLSRGERISAVENTALKTLYADILNGKPNKYMLFMARAHALLKSGGVCSFIVPNSWLGIRSAKALRQMFLAEGALTDIEVLDFDPFSAPSVETVIFRVQKGEKSPSINVRHVLKREDLGDREGAALPTETCLKTPGLTIPLTWSNDAEKLLKALSRGCTPLRKFTDLFNPLIALQVYAAGKGSPPQTKDQVRNHVFHTSMPDSEVCYPYLAGSDIRRYGVSWSGRYHRYGPWLAENHPLERFMGPRVVIREILSRGPYILTCTMIEEISIYNRSVLHIIRGCSGTRDDMLALTAILNSRTASSIIMHLGQKSQRRLFPKVVNDDILNFPVPSSWNDAVPILAPLAAERLHSGPDSTPGSKMLEKKIDEAVAEIYRVI